MKTAYLYSVKLGILVELLVLALIVLFAKPITSLFTYSNSSKLISSDMVKALRILVWTLPFTPLGMLTSSLFQGIGDGYKSLTVTILRTVVMQIRTCLCLSFTSESAECGGELWPAILLPLLVLDA